jgi:hypothetical protein
MKKKIQTALLILFGFAGLVCADQGNPGISSIESIAFGPDGLLLIGGGARIAIVATGDTKPVKWTKAEISNIDQLLAGKLGLQAKDIEVRKMVVNPMSQKAYVALQALKTKASIILTIDGAGNVAELPLENVRYKAYPLTTPNAPVTKVTDIAWAGGKIVVSTQATDVFASRVFTIDPTDRSGPPVQVSTKTYHIAHKKWETQAPLRTLMPVVAGGKTSVVGSFTCTPVVRYDLDDAKNDEQVTGRSVLELGSGNMPLGMFAYNRGGKSFILVSVCRGNKKPAFGFPSAYWVARMDADLLQETTNTNENAFWRVGNTKLVGERVEVATNYFGVRQMDRLDATQALAIVETDGAFSLRSLQLP